jgi:hypothetical protein
MTKLTEKEIAERIADLMIESSHPEHNAYNWGLAHAQLVFQGGSVEAIRATQPK